MRVLGALHFKSTYFLFFWQCVVEKGRRYYTRYSIFFLRVLSWTRIEQIAPIIIKKDVVEHTLGIVCTRVVLP